MSELCLRLYLDEYEVRISSILVIAVITDVASDPSILSTFLSRPPPNKLKKVTPRIMLLLEGLVGYSSLCGDRLTTILAHPHPTPLLPLLSHLRRPHGTLSST